MLRRFYYLTVQFFICSDCHPFWGQIVGMRKPGYLGADWFCAFRACCPTFCLNIFAICFILHTLSVPGNRLKNINAYYINFCPVHRVYLVERVSINTYATHICNLNYYLSAKNIFISIIELIMLDVRPNFLPNPPRTILPKKTGYLLKNLPKNVPRIFPRIFSKILPKILPKKFPKKVEIFPKKAEIFPKIQPRVTQHRRTTWRYQFCASLLRNKNNKSIRAPLHTCYNLTRYLKNYAKFIIYLKLVRETLISMYCAIHFCYMEIHLLISSLTHIDLFHRISCYLATYYLIFYPLTHILQYALIYFFYFRNCNTAGASSDATGYAENEPINPDQFSACIELLSTNPGQSSAFYTEISHYASCYIATCFVIFYALIYTLHYALTYFFYFRNFINLHPQLPLPPCFSSNMLYFITTFRNKTIFSLFTPKYAFAILSHNFASTYINFRTSDRISNSRNNIHTHWKLPTNLQFSHIRIFRGNRAKHALIYNQAGFLLSALIQSACPLHNLKTILLNESKKHRLIVLSAPIIQSCIINHPSKNCNQLKNAKHLHSCYSKPASSYHVLIRFIISLIYSYLFSQVLAIFLHCKDSRTPAFQPTPECLPYTMDPLPHLQLVNLLQPTSTQREEGTGVALTGTDSEYHLHSYLSKPASNYHVLIRFINLHPQLPLPPFFSSNMLYFITTFCNKTIFSFFTPKYAFAIIHKLIQFKICTPTCRHITLNINYKLANSGNVHPNPGPLDHLLQILAEKKPRP